MRFQHIIEAVYFQPWAITREGWNTIHKVVGPRLKGGLALDVKSESDDEDFFGQPLPCMAIEGDLAIIPIYGPLIQHAGLIEKKCGACSYQDVMQSCRDAEMNPKVRAILFDVGSPGGMAVGMIEAAKCIARCKKPTYAFVDTQACSAAYALIAGAKEIYSTPSAFSGCIGALFTVEDTHRMFEEAGIDVHLFATGKYKGAGSDGVAMTEDHAEYFQGIVDDFGRQVKAHVMEHRPQISDGSMQGQAFIGDRAFELGIVDQLSDDIEEVKEWL